MCFVYFLHSIHPHDVSFTEEQTSPPMTPSSSDSSPLASMRRELLCLDTQKKSLLSEAEAIVSELTAKQPGGVSLSRKHRPPSGHFFAVAALLGGIASLVVISVLTSSSLVLHCSSACFCSQGPPIGIDSPLVDTEGYPRADIDIYRARTLRRRFKEIQTDHKALERGIDSGLAEIAALSKVSGGENISISATTAKDEEEELKLRLAPKPKPKFDPKTGKWVVKSWDGSVAGVEDGEARSFDDLSAPSAAALAASLAAAARPVVGTTGATGGNDPSDVGQRRQQEQLGVSFPEHTAAAVTPFAIIDEVSPDSPASEAGIKEKDVLLRFGDVDHTNHREFRAIAELLPSVAASEDGKITVVVRRKTSDLGGFAELTKTEVVELRPRPWGGRGLLGCHIRPYSD